MNVKREVICRLCLRDAINEFREIDEAVEQMFDILSFKLDLKISEDPIICQDCLGVATKCLSFKSSCIDTEKIIHSYLSGVEPEQVKYSIKAIYNRWKQVETVIDKDLNICRICMVLSEKNNFVCMEAAMDENLFKICIPEMDFNIIEDPVICATCRESLQSYLNFTLNYLDTEEKIKAYCREEGTDGMGQVELGKILLFLFKYPFDCPQKCAFKEELNTFETTENAYLDRDSGLVKHKELDIKEEEINLRENSYESLSEIKFNKCDDMFHPMECSIEAKLNVISLKTKKEYDNKEGTCQKKIQANIVEVSSILEDILKIKSNNSDETSALKNYTICEDDSKTKEKNNINRHVLIQKNPLNRQGYLSVRKNILQIRKHKCPSCTYETKYKSYLAKHTLIHKDPSEIKMHMCSFCAYEFKRRGALRRHMLTHMESSERYKCSLCAYESKLKLGLDRHMLVHKDPSEIKMHKCSFCAYKAKRKQDLRRHMFSKHNVSSETEINKCSICGYKLNKKCHHEEHMLRQHNKLPINKKS